MPKFLIERNVPGAGRLSAGDLSALSRKSCEVLNDLGPAIQWVQSYVTDDSIACVYVAPNAASTPAAAVSQPIGSAQSGLLSTLRPLKPELGT
ncbi:MAG TPA: DUF4242 domain-containing protein [Tepidiformaceae bacterium]|nr:DUF4242 domain-containing protein [Tepidiformaceae bacterium]